MSSINWKRLSIFKVNLDGGDGILHFEYAGLISREDASILQSVAGYHPLGYGFFAYNMSDGITKWRCDGGLIQ